MAYLKSMAENEEFNKEQARIHLGVSLRTLQRLTTREEEEGKIPCHTKRGPKGNETWYFKSDLDAYLQKRHPPVMLPFSAPAMSPDVTPDTGLVLRQSLPALLSPVEDALIALRSVLEDRRLLDDRFLTFKQASDEFGLSMAVLKRAVAQGELKLYPVGIRGAKVVRLSEVRAFIRTL
jgi:predicted DNA-binding protein (UPF0251 family)